MPSRIWWAAALLALLAPASLAFKLATMSHDDRVSLAGSGGRVAPSVVELLSAEGYQPLGLQRLINSDAYAVQVFLHQTGACEGLLYLLPMAVNAEAGALLGRPGGRLSADHFFVFRGRISALFPSLDHWLAGLAGRLTTLLGQPAPDLTVYGVATTEACLTPRAIDWARLAD